jgi:hypothetical protein
MTIEEVIGWSLTIPAFFLALYVYARFVKVRREAAYYKKMWLAELATMTRRLIKEEDNEANSDI